MFVSHAQPQMNPSCAKKMSGPALLSQQSAQMTEHKQEIDSALIASAKVVADSLEQSCAIGDVHHAIAHGLMRKEDVYAELCEIVAGQKIGRVADDEIIVFDSTGVAIEDAVAAAAVYERALANGIGTDFDFAA